MTRIMVSKRDGIATEPNGTKHRIARGKTLADARHPLVEAYPGDWQPMEVALAVSDDDTPAGAPSHAEQLQRDNELDSLTNDLAEAEETAEGYRKQLAAVVEVLAQRGALPHDEAPQEGWLAVAVAGALDAHRQSLAPGELPIDEHLPATVPPPKPPRAAKRAAPRADG